MKRAQNLYLGEVSECRLLDPFGFFMDAQKIDRGLIYPPARDRVKLNTLYICLE